VTHDIYAPSRKGPTRSFLWAQLPAGNPQLCLPQHEAEELRSGAGLRLGVEPVQRRLDRGFRDAAVLSDAPVRLAFGDTLEDPLVAVGQRMLRCGAGTGGK